MPSRTGLCTDRRRWCLFLRSRHGPCVEPGRRGLSVASRRCGSRHGPFGSVGFQPYSSYCVCLCQIAAHEARRVLCMISAGDRRSGALQGPKAGPSEWPPWRGWHAGARVHGPGARAGQGDMGQARHLPALRAGRADLHVPCCALHELAEYAVCFKRQFLFREFLITVCGDDFIGALWLAVQSLCFVGNGVSRCV